MATSSITFEPSPLKRSPLRAIHRPPVAAPTALHPVFTAAHSYDLAQAQGAMETRAGS
jgi:hypothetical protein